MPTDIARTPSHDAVTYAPGELDDDKLSLDRAPNFHIPHSTCLSHVGTDALCSFEALSILPQGGSRVIKIYSFVLQPPNVSNWRIHHITHVRRDKCNQTIGEVGRNTGTDWASACHAARL